MFRGDPIEISATSLFYRRKSEFLWLSCSYVLDNRFNRFNTIDRETGRRTNRQCAIYNCAMVTRDKYLKLKTTSGYAMVVHGRPKTLKNTSFFLGGGVTQPPGVVQPLYSKRHITSVLVWSKSVEDGWEKLYTNKHTDRQTNRQIDTTKIMVTWPWTKKYLTA